MFSNLLSLSQSTERENTSREAFWIRSISVLVDTLSQLLQRTTYIAQSQWAVDAVNGNDDASGVPSDPLRSLAELDRRFLARIISPDISALSIALIGDFADQALDLSLVSAGQCTVTISGQMRTVRQGTLATYVAPVPPNRGSVTDATVVDWSPDQSRRLRITSGTKTGAIAHLGTGAGATGYISQPYLFPFTTANPSPGAAYLIETYATRINGGSRIRPSPNALIVVRDIEFGVPSAAATTPDNAYHLWQGADADFGSVRFFGCSFTGYDTSSWHIFGGKSLLTACVNYIGHIEIEDGLTAFRGWMHSADFLVGVQGGAVAADITHDGLGTHNAGLIVEGYLNDFTSRGLFNLASTVAVTIESGGIHIATQLWGNSGASVAAIQVKSQGRFVYVNLPTLGAANDTIVGGTPKVYGLLPFTNPTNGAAIVSYA